MTGQRVATTADGEGQEAGIAAYLEAHPDFFERHTALLEELRVPHARGSAVSLVERQVETLRSDNRRLRQQIQELIAVAKANDQLGRRLHRLTLAMIDASDLTEVLNCLEDHLHAELRADAVGLRLFPAAALRRGPETADGAPADPELAPFLGLFRRARPRCGRPSPAQLERLFGSQAADLESAALLPLVGDDILGVLGIGSGDPQRFHPHMGTELLVRLGEIVVRKLQVVSLPGT
jgi:uncharacterized protein